METQKSNINILQHFVTMTIIVVLACAALFSLDKDTHHITDLFKPVNLVAFIIYFVPTMLVCTLFYAFLLKKYRETKRLMISLFAGIPVGFILVISVMLLIKP